MDTYQPIYDAVRSRICNGDIGSAVQEALNACNMGHYADMAYRSIEQVAAQYDKPSAIYRPKVYVDGSKWCALYGDDLQAGVAGFGDSPAAAMDAFDAKWYRKLQPATPPPELIPGVRAELDALTVRKGVANDPA